MIDDRAEIDQHTRFNRRAMLLFGAQVGVAGLLGARLYQLQLVENEAYATLAEENRVNLEPLAPPRGRIYDRSGQPLAINRPNYRLNFVRERAASVEETLARLRRLVTLSDREVERLMRRLARTRGFVPVSVKENLSWEEFARVNANAPALPGVSPSIGWVRDYPEGDDLAHVVGYVAAVTEDDLARDESGDPLLRLPDARIGKNGVEKFAEAALRGSAGRRRIEVNAGGREIRELSRDPGAPGPDLDLTIDLPLQRYAMRRLQGESAAAVVIDVRNGDLLCLASAPAYDPNKFVFGIGVDDWNALREDEYDPLRNKALAGAYPPGSTFKMITALAALQHGEMTPTETVFCNGRYPFGDRIFHCWRRRGHGPMQLKTAIQKSCDVYFYEAAKRVGIERLAELASRFGIGERFDIEAPNVKSGNLPTPDWMFGARGVRWSGGDTLNVGIGQGALLTTPLQLAVMTARLANGRDRVRPRLVRARGGAPLAEPAFEPLDVDQGKLKLVLDAMNAVSNESGGTAFRSRIDDPDRQLAGKTGTAQVRRISMEERQAGVRKNEDLPWRLRDHALYVAFAPLEKPRYAIAVVVEHGGGGSKAAAPVARDIMMRALWAGEPPLDAYPTWARADETARREAWAAEDAAQAASAGSGGASGPAAGPGAPPNSPSPPDLAPGPAGAPLGDGEQDAGFWGLDDDGRPWPRLRRG